MVEQAWQVVKRATIAKRREKENDNFILLLLCLLCLVVMKGCLFVRGISSLGTAPNNRWVDLMVVDVCDIDLDDMLHSLSQTVCLSNMYISLLATLITWS